jgi:hypothetical protein
MERKKIKLEGSPEEAAQKLADTLTKYLGK